MSESGKWPLRNSKQKHTERRSPFRTHINMVGSNTRKIWESVVFIGWFSLFWIRKKDTENYIQCHWMPSVFLAFIDQWPYLPIRQGSCFFLIAVLYSSTNVLILSSELCTTLHLWPSLFNWLTLISNWVWSLN